jgi:hypothetical protein
MSEEVWGTVYHRERFEKPELERLRTEVEQLRSAAVNPILADAIDQALVGGNHLALLQNQTRRLSTTAQATLTRFGARGDP